MSKDEVYGTIFLKANGLIRKQSAKNNKSTVIKLDFLGGKRKSLFIFRLKLSLGTQV